MSLTITERDLVSIIALNRPEKLNAIDKSMAMELQEAFQLFESSSQRAVVLTGIGNSFCSGADVTDLPEMWRCVPGVGFESRKPIIVATNGWCVGGAMVMCMMSDIAIASETTKFYYPEANRGFTGGMIAGLAARIPHKIAMEVMMLGEPLSAARAYEVGFVNRVTPEGEQLEEAVRWATRLASAAPMVLRTFKKFVNQNILPAGPAEIAARVSRDIQMVKTSRDREEGLAALREKRSPNFVGQ